MLNNYKVIRLRSVMGLSQEDFGQVIGTTKRSIQNYEQDLVDFNKADRFTRMKFNDLWKEQFGN